MPIFPEFSLSASIITTVWVGVWVVCFFNLRFGWVLSGLVVPGYLVPLAILTPWSAAVIVLEGVVTYGLVYSYSNVLAPRIGLTLLFGRDRFFALVLASILVRLVFDTALLPALGPWLESISPWPLDYRYDLHSFGLIVVALIANQFWKPGIKNGLIPFLVILGVTFLLVRYGLMEWTNFTMSSIAFLYEDMAASMLASPKAYIVIVTTAFVASRMNLNYGWDFNGILMPALLALQWYEPTKILTTFVEALLIYGVGSLLLKTPLFRDVTMEGARKLLFFFNVGFAYKMLLGFALAYLAPEVKVSDFFAFGYLLSTLLAVKMYQTAAPLRLIRATVQTSLFAVAVASAIGFALTLMPTPFQLDSDEQQRQRLASETIESLPGAVGRAKLALYSARGTNDLKAASVFDLERFSQALQWLQQAEPDDEDKALQLLAEIGYRLLKVGPEWRILYPTDQADEASVFILRPAASAGVVSLPAALDNRHLLAAGLSTAIDSDWCCVAATAKPTTANRRETYFHEFHRQFGREKILQIRLPERTVASTHAAELWINGQLPGNLDLDNLQRKLGTLAVRIGSLPRSTPQVGLTSAYAMLVTGSDRLRRLRLLGVSDQPDTLAEFAGSLPEWIARLPVAASGSNRYQPPDTAALLLADEEIFQPLFDLALRWDGTDEASRRDELRTVAGAAAHLGFRVALSEHQGQHFVAVGECALFAETSCEPDYQGAFLIRLGGQADTIYQLPSPGFEGRLLRLATDLFLAGQARALLLSSVRPDANVDGSARLHNREAVQSYLSLASEVALREPRYGVDSLIQLRVSPQALLNGQQVALALSGGRGLEQMVGAEERFAESLETSGLSWALVAGDAAGRDLRAHRSVQIQYLEDTQRGQGMLAWFDTSVTASARGSGGLTDDFLLGLGIERRSGTLLEAAQVDSAGRLAWRSTPTTLRDSLTSWLRSRDINRLLAIQQRYALLAVTSSNTQQTILLVSDQQQQLLAALNLDTTRSAAIEQSKSVTPQVLEDFVASRAALLLLSEEGG